MANDALDEQLRQCESDGRPVRVKVVTPQAELRSGNNLLVKIPVGKTLVVTKVSNLSGRKWLGTSYTEGTTTYNGWIDRSAVGPPDPPSPSAEAGTLHSSTKPGGGIHSGAGLFHSRTSSQSFLRDTMDQRERLEVAAFVKARANFDSQSPQFAAALTRLAAFYEENGNFSKALPLYRQAMEIDRSRFGPVSTECLDATDRVARTCLELEDYSTVEPLLSEELKSVEQVLGRESPRYATVLNHLAEFYLETGDYARALPLYTEALAVRKKTLGEQDREYGVTLHNLGVLLERQGNYGEAEERWKEELRLAEVRAGKKDPDYAHTLSSLALLAARTGKYAEAETLFKTARQIFNESGDDGSLDYARILNNLGYVYIHTGQFDQARGLLDDALRLRRQRLGDLHPDVADSLNDLALLCHAMHRVAEAADFSRSSLQITRQCVKLASALQSERQQLAIRAMYRDRLDLYLSIVTDAKLSIDDAYSEVFAWKGSVFARQRQLRVQRSVPELSPLLARLNDLSRRLARRAFQQPPAGDEAQWKAELQRLIKEMEQCESLIAKQSAELRAKRVSTPLSVGDLRTLLPEKAVLFDYLEYARHDFSAEGKLSKERRFIVFVVDHAGPVRAVELGTEKDIRGALDRWRTMLLAKAGSDQGGAGSEVRRLILQPLEPYLEGANLLLISPDGALNSAPFAALPGKSPGSYLLEDIPTVVVPSPRLLPRLLANRDDASGASGDPSMLLVGDVAFDSTTAGPEVSAVAAKPAWQRRRAGLMKKWTPLPATRGEIMTIGDSFKKALPQKEPKVLREAAATAVAVRAEAPMYSYLHFATHGFFLPVEKSAGPETRGNANYDSGSLAGGYNALAIHPGLLSGLVFAGANAPQAEGDDGLLSALEVAELDLGKAELVVLSACDTGLGTVAGGEGVLGLQRAFQVAGARSVVTSLWKIDDQATRMLMEKFYENYWQKQMSAIESLREAQLEMLREGRKRGIVREDELTVTVDPKRAPPFYWAAFVLSGDWR